MNAFIIACASCALQAAHTLSHSDPHIPEASGASLPGLHSAVLSGRADLVQSVLADGADPNSPQDSGAVTTPAYAAAFAGRVDLLRLLLAAGGDVARATPNGTTPLHAAAYNGHLPAVRCLIAAGHPPRTPRHDGTVPLVLAASAGHTHVVAELLCGAPTQDCSAALCMAVTHGRLEMVQMLLSAGVNPNDLGPCKLPCAYVAAWHGGLEIMEVPHFHYGRLPCPHRTHSEIGRPGVRHTFRP